MKRILIPFLLICSMLPEIRAQYVDTARYGEDWMMFWPWTEQYTYFRKTCPLNVPIDPTDPYSGVTIRDELPPVFDTFSPIFGSTNTFGYSYPTDTDQTVYGMAVTMNVNRIFEGDCDSLMQEFAKLYLFWGATCHNSEGVFGSVDDGYSAMLLDGTHRYYPGGMVADFDLLDSVHLGTSDIDQDVWRYRGHHIRRSTYIYEFDTLWPNDTIDLLEFYFKKPYHYNAGDTIFLAQQYSMMDWTDADYIFSPHYAITVHPSTTYLHPLLVWAIAVDSFPAKIGVTTSANSIAFTAPLGKLNSQEPAAHFPHIMPIVRLRCSDPTGWQAERDSSEVMLRWDYFGGCDGYEVLVNNVTGHDSTVHYIDNPDAESFLVSGITDTDYYRIRVRSCCRYTTAGYDTVVHGEWTDPIVYGTLPPDWNPDDTTGNGHGSDTTGHGGTDTTIVDTTGIALAAGMQFGLHPNPASGSVTVEAPTAEGGLLTLTDLAGREVMRQQLPAGRTEHRIDIGMLPTGTYLLRLVTPAGTGTQRLLVQ